jgi:ferrochelatase
MKIAIVLFNLGGPDSPAAVRPFLQNLFNDPAIIGVPTPFRWLLAYWIAFRRAPVAQKIYQHLGGKSPILDLTQKQAQALEQQFSGDDEIKTFISMRYWHPMSNETAQSVKNFSPDQIILLPLYPQFSTTTTGSSLNDWKRAAEQAGLEAPSTAVCCYPDEPGFIKAVASLVENEINQASKNGKPRVLFSAHGLPKKIVDGGDPYPDHIKLTAAAVVARLDRVNLDWVVCYQSRVGPLQWIGPSTEDEIARAAKDGVPIVIVPIAFVSEHSETLVELDIEYRELAEELGITAYHRAATVSTNRHFIEGLKSSVDRALKSTREGVISCCTNKGACSSYVKCCPLIKIK